jgi:hypothetical protein
MWAAPLLGVLSLAQVVGGEVDDPPGQGVADGEDGSGESEPDPVWLFTGKCPANGVCRNVPTKNIAFNLSIRPTHPLLLLRN